MELQSTHGKAGCNTHTQRLVERVAIHRGDSCCSTKMKQLHQGTSSHQSMVHGVLHSPRQVYVDHWPSVQVAVVLEGV